MAGNTIYSTRFIAEAVSGGYGAIYTVPAGRVAVVTSINCVSLGSGTSDAQVTVGSVLLWRADPLVANGFASWVGHQVANPGEQLRTYTGGGPLHWAISGYLLTVVP